MAHWHASEQQYRHRSAITLQKLRISIHIGQRYGGQRVAPAECFELVLQLLAQVAIDTRNQHQARAAWRRYQ